MTHRSVRSSVFISLVLFFAAVFSGSRLLNAQGASSTGTVTDSQGATIARAVVRLLDAQHREVRATLTDDAGKFRVDVAGCTGCTIEASLAGFTPASASSGAAEMKLVLKFAPVRESVIVSATRDEVPAGQVGASTTVITSTEIDRRGAMVVSDLLRDVPGMTVVRNGGQGGLTSVFTRAGESNYNKVLLDGVPINEPGGTFNFNSLTTGNLDRIEIVRGAQSALFGSDAMSSVIQLVTKRGSGVGQRPHGSVTFAGGSDSTARGGAELRGESGRFDYSVHGSGLGTDNQSPNNRFTDTTFSWNSGALLQPGVTLRTVGRLEWSRAGTPGQTAFGRPDLDAFFQRHDTVAGVTLEHERGNMKGRLTYAFSTSEQVSTNLVVDPPYFPAFGTNSGPFSFSDFLYNSDNTLSRHRLSYQADWRLGGAGRLISNQFVTAAVDFDGERATLADVMNATTVNASRNNTGVTFQYQAVSSWIAVVAGVRAEDNASFGTTGVPRVSVSSTVHRGSGPVGETKLKFNAGLGVKEPTILQTFSLNPFFLGNPNLLAERARTVDFGVEQRFASDRAKVDAVWFDNRYRNQITTVTSQFQNVGLTTARGLELAADTQATQAIRVRGGYTFTDSEIVTSTNAFSPVFAVGNSAFRRPRHSGFLSAAVEHRGAGIELTGTFVGTRTDSDFFSLGTPITALDPYSVWTLAGHYQATPRLDIFGRIENLTDTVYMEPVGYLALRRAAFAGIRVGF